MSGGQHGGAVRLGVLSDLHLDDPGAPDTRWHNPVRRGLSRHLLTRAVELLSRWRVDALVVLGDLSDRGRAEDYAFLARAVPGMAD